MSRNVGIFDPIARIGAGTVTFSDAFDKFKAEREAAAIKADTARMQAQERNLAARGRLEAQMDRYEARRSGQAQISVSDNQRGNVSTLTITEDGRTTRYQEGVGSDQQSREGGRRVPFTAHTHASGEWQRAQQERQAQTGTTGTLAPLQVGGLNPDQVRVVRQAIDAINDLESSKGRGAFKLLADDFNKTVSTGTKGGLFNFTSDIPVTQPNGDVITVKAGKYTPADLVNALTPQMEVSQQTKTAINASLGVAAPAQAPAGPAAGAQPANPAAAKPPAAGKVSDTAPQPPAAGGMMTTGLKINDPAPAVVQTSTKPASPAAAPAPRERDYTDKSIPTAALNGPVAKAYGVKKEDMPDGMRANQVPDIQKMLKAANYDISYTGKDGKKHDGLDGQFGEKSLKALQAACKAAGVNIKDVNFANPTDPEFIKLQTHLNTAAREQAPFKEGGIAQNAPAVAPFAAREVAASPERDALLKQLYAENPKGEKTIADIDARASAAFGGMKSAQGFGITNDGKFDTHELIMVGNRDLSNKPAIKQALDALMAREGITVGANGEYRDNGPRQVAAAATAELSHALDQDTFVTTPRPVLSPEQLAAMGSPVTGPLLKTEEPQPRPVPDVTAAAAPASAAPANDTHGIPALQMAELRGLMTQSASTGTLLTDAQQVRVYDILAQSNNVGTVSQMLADELRQQGSVALEQPAPVVVPAPVMQQTASTTASATNEPSPFATASFGGFGGNEAPAINGFPPAVQTSLQAARDAGVTNQQFAVLDTAEAQSRAGGAKRTNEAGLTA